MTTYAQIASWTDSEVERIGKQIGAYPGRIRRDDWVGGAQTEQNESGDHDT